MILAAIMIMCHKNADQVIRLAERCLSKDTDVFIHADSAMPSDEYRILMTFREHNQGKVFLTDSRIHGELYSRSLVDIALLMVKTALNEAKRNEKHYHYYALLSGQDYPIKPIEEIVRELDLCYPSPIIDCTPWKRKNWVWYKTKSDAKLCRANRKVSFESKGLFRLVGRMSIYAVEVIMRSLRIDAHSKMERKGIAMYGGSQWWILPDQVMEYILAEYERGDSDTEFLLNHVFTPDETFFQIMTMRHPLSEDVALNPPDMVAQSNQTWSYFTDEGKPATGHPYIITKSEFDKIAGLNCFFARKFDAAVDNEILDMIDHDLLIPANRK